MNVGFRFANSGERIPIRLYLTNDSGYYLDMSTYREVMNERTGEVGLFWQLSFTDFKNFFMIL